MKTFSEIVYSTENLFSLEKSNSTSSNANNWTTAAANGVSLGLIGAGGGYLGYRAYKNHQFVKASDKILAEHGIGNYKTLHMRDESSLDGDERRKIKDAYSSILAQKNQAAKAGDAKRAEEFELAAQRLRHLVR